MGPIPKREYKLPWTAVTGKACKPQPPMYMYMYMLLQAANTHRKEKEKAGVVGGG